MNLQAAIARGVKAFIVLIVAAGAASFAGLSSTPIDLSNPKKTIGTLVIAFVIGFVISLGKILRDKFGNPQGGGLVNTLTP